MSQKNTSSRCQWRAVAVTAAVILSLGLGQTSTTLSHCADDDDDTANSEPDRISVPQTAPGLGEVRRASAKESILHMLELRDAQIKANWRKDGVVREHNMPGLATGTTAISYGTANWPDVLTLNDARRHAKMLELDGSEKRSWLLAFAEYQESVLAAQREDVPAGNRRFQEITEDRAPDDRHERARLHTEFRNNVIRQFERRLRAYEHEFHLSAFEILSNDPRIRNAIWIEADRDRALRTPFGHGLLRSANFDLIRALDDEEIEVDWSGEQGDILRQYLEEFYTRAHLKRQALERVSTVGRELDKRRAELSAEDYAAQWRRLTRSSNDLTIQHSRANREFLERLAATLDEDAAARLTNRFKQIAYLGLHPDHSRKRLDRLIERLEEREEVTEEHWRAIDEIMQEFEQWHETFHRAAEREREELSLQRMRAAVYDHEAALAHSRRMGEHRREREQKVRSTMERILEVANIVLPPERMRDR